MVYRVWRIEYNTMQDPLMPPGTRYHNALFIETETDGGGHIIQVDGAIGQTGGMTFENKQLSEKPDQIDSYHRQHYLGTIAAHQLDSIVNLIKTQCPAPPQQRNFSTKTYQIEPCKPDGSFYLAGEKVSPYEKCTEWTMKKAIPALQQSGYLDMTPPPKAMDWIWDAARQQHWRYILVVDEWKTETKPTH
jgi:hypothetical protein